MIAPKDNFNISQYFLSPHRDKPHEISAIEHIIFPLPEIKAACSFLLELIAAIAYCRLLRFTHFQKNMSIIDGNIIVVIIR